MDFLSQTYVALRGPTGVQQTPSDTISRLSDRLSPATLLADRRAAVLSLKGLSRDCKQQVGETALPGLLEVLYNDAEVDADIAKASLETLTLLCDTENVTGNSRELGFKHTDIILASEKAVHTIFSLLADFNFYTRYSTLQFASTLLHNRRHTLQSYFLTAPAGPRSIIAALEDKREIIRNEAIAIVEALMSQSPDIQKVLAFEGAFEKLFGIVTQDGGVDGAVVAQGALSCIDTLLRFNSSNQSYFRETSFPPLLFAFLQFPVSLSLDQPAPQEFALQFWDDKKRVNVSLVLGILGMLLASKGPGTQDNLPYARCLIELALASNAPTSLKAQALRLIPTNIILPLSQFLVTPYLPVPETNGEEWDRLEPASALVVLIELALHGEFNGLDSREATKDNLELRTAALTVFENFVNQLEIRLAILQDMLPPEDSDTHPRPNSLLHALSTPPNSLDFSDVTSTQIAAFMFSYLLRGSSRAKSAGCQIIPGPPPPLETPSFFVPADGGPPAPTEKNDEEEEESQPLLQILTENLSLALLSRSRETTSDSDARVWDRYIVGYLCLLSQWLWEDPKSVREFLEAGGLGVLVESINQTLDSNLLVPGLCAFLLGICYEFNREPGEITRDTIHPIINRLSVDILVGKMLKIREDERFKSVGPDSMVIHGATLQPKSSNAVEAEIWFDWSFVDFWKSNYYTVQRGFSADPDQLSTANEQNAETQILIASLRDVIRKQLAEIGALEKRLKESSHSQTTDLQDLRKQVGELTAELQDSEQKRKDVEKEQEDLLVLLDEVEMKRKRDKDRLREAGLEVSEDEGDEDDDGDE